MAFISLIVGLGNPGAEYDGTRHNAGFRFVDELARQHGVQFRDEAKLYGKAAKLSIGSDSIWLLKPSTFMNRSGQSVSAALRYFKIAPENMLIAHDELDLAPGIARLKFDGGHGGQNGLRDIFSHLGHGKFHRLRIGIGHPGHKDKVTPWVLSRAGRDDDAAIARGIDEALAALPLLLEGRPEEAMKKLHTTKP
ncbi:MAG: aminoacyl-tRNA hydrolase [Lysobacteraceae bacterium]